LIAKINRASDCIPVSGSRACIYQCASILLATAVQQDPFKSGRPAQLMAAQKNHFRFAKMASRMAGNPELNRWVKCTSIRV
jgi:hypothetical protein